MEIDPSIRLDFRPQSAILSAMDNPNENKRTIAVDTDVFRALQSKAEPLVDDANSVLRKLLNLSSAGAAAPRAAPARAAKKTAKRSAKKTAKKAVEKAAVKKAAPKPVRKRARRGSLVPESAFEVPLLEALVELGGSAQAGKVTARIGEKLADRLTAVDRESVASGGVRWQSRAQTVRMKLIKDGQLKSDSPRGVWEISDAGRARLSPATSPVSSVAPPAPAVPPPPVPSDPAGTPAAPGTTPPAPNPSTDW